MRKQRRDSKLYAYEGEQRNLTEIARLAGMKPVTLWIRMRRNGLTLAEAVSKPVRSYGKSKW